MPDGAAANLTYEPATRGRFAPLIMVSGQSGTGKTFSALRLAKGMAGDGTIFVADTDNSRARLYADTFDFMHLDLREPFRPMLFEQAAIAAHKQHAAVLIIDNFAAEWVGPGGVLEWHEEELTRLAGDNYQRRESLKMVCWGKVKPPHKHMLQRLYQINMPIILCCAAEKKIAMIKATEGKDKGKITPTDQGFQPIGDKDAAYAMTASLLLEDVNRPGVPRPIKALLPALRDIIHLDRPLDEETGQRIAAWAKGEKAPPVVTGVSTSITTKAPAPAQQGDAPTEAGKGGLSPPSEHEPPGSDSREGDPSPPPPDAPPPEDDGRSEDPPDRPVDADEQRVVDGARMLAGRFIGIVDRAEHLAIVDEPAVQKQIAWLRRHRKDLWQEVVKPTIDASWKRTDVKAEAEQQQDMKL